jgi:hypothetical protein
MANGASVLDKKRADGGETVEAEAMGRAIQAVVSAMWQTAPVWTLGKVTLRERVKTEKIAQNQGIVRVAVLLNRIP